MNRALVHTGIFASMMLFVSTVSAQENSLSAGKSSLSFALPNGNNGYANGAAGLWRMMTDQMNVGFNVGLALDTAAPDGAGDTTTAYDLLLAPAIRYYCAEHLAGKVVPFWHGQLNLRLHDDGVDPSDDPELSIAGGLGAEWFVTQQFSLAGQVGVGIDLIRANDVDPLALGTFTSGLTGQFYF